MAARTRLFSPIPLLVGLNFIALTTTGVTQAHEPHPRVASLPVLARIEVPKSTPIVLRGELPKKQARSMERLARAILTDVSSRFLSAKDKSSLAPVDVCLFAGDGSYAPFVQAVYGDDHDFSMLGFYSPAHRMVVANVGRSSGNLRHELAHALLGDDFPDMPAWLNEGVGALYGSARRTRTGFRFLVNYRLRHLRKALAAGRLPDLSQLAASGRREVYGATTASAYYALSRYVLLYLDRKGELASFWEAMRAEPLTEQRQLIVLRRFVDFDRFLKWTRKQRLETGTRSARRESGAR